MPGELRPPLDGELLRTRLVRPGALWTRLDVVDDTESTNADLAAAARSGAPEGRVLTAEHQSSGRGRLGRTWTTPPRSALLTSVLLRPVAVPVARWPWLGLLVPLAVASAVRRLTGVPAEVKWPNDVLVADRKLAGILLEQVDGQAAVVGMGLNVTLQADERPQPAATSLALEAATTTDRTTILVALLRELELRYADWLASGGDPAVVLPEYQELSATLGRRVRTELPDGTFLEGTATALDPDGRLVVDTGTSHHALAAADVTHLRPADRSPEPR